MSDQALAAITSLAASVASLQAQVGVLSSQVATKADATAVSALSSTVTAEGGHVTTLTNRVAEARATTSLTSRVTSCEPADLLIDAGQEVQPLRMGKVVFHGETARAIRDAQEVLRAAGAGQLEVVKRESEGDSPFVVIDGQVFIAEATVESAVIDPARFNIRLDATEQGIPIATGFALCVDLEPQFDLGSQLAEAFRAVIRDELKPGGMLHRS